MQAHELEWFLAVVQDANLTRVAAERSLSQPALSRALRRLEAEVGAPLFDRVGRGLEPNPRGRAFAEHARRALAELQAGVDAVRGAVDPAGGEVRLGFLHTLGTWLVPDLISAFRAERPGVALRLRQAAADTMVQGLLEGRHDLLLTSPRPSDAAIAWTPLFSEPLALVVPPGHRLSGRRRVRLAEIAGEPFVSLRRGLGLRAIIEAMCAQAGFEPRVAFEGQEVATVRGLVRAGLGVSVVPVRPPELADPDTIALGDPGGRREIGIAVHRRRHRPPAADAFAALVAERAAAIAAGSAGGTPSERPAAG